MAALRGRKTTGYRHGVDHARRVPPVALEQFGDEHAAAERSYSVPRNVRVFASALVVEADRSGKRRRAFLESRDELWLGS